MKNNILLDINNSLYYFEVNSVNNDTVSVFIGGSGVRLHDGPDLKLFILVGWDRSFRLLLGPPGLN